MQMARRGFTLIETLVVLAIISILIGLLMPAIHAARERAHETVCKNNLHQLEIATHHFLDVHDQLPDSVLPGNVGGWKYSLLPFLDAAALHDPWLEGRSMDDAPSSLGRPPRVMRCPSRSIEAREDRQIEEAHYVLVRQKGRCWSIFDTPVDVHKPWLAGPEMSYQSVTTATGPHNGGFHFTDSAGGVNLILDGVIFR